MMKCPFCHFDNEDGALFCEQCKSDLTAVEAPPPPKVASKPPSFAPRPAPAPFPPPAAVPVAATPVQMTETLPLTGDRDAAPVLEPLPAAQIPTADVIPMAAEVVATPTRRPPPPGLEEVEMPDNDVIPIAEPLPAEPIPSAEFVAPPPPASPNFPELLTANAQPATAPAPPPPPPPAPPAPVASAPPAPAPVAAPSPAAAPTLAPLGADPGQIPAGKEPKLVVLRGQKRNVEYPLYEGLNFIGRADEKPVDIDLEDQEPPDRVWSSRQHALITFEEARLAIEDLNSSNGTFVNRARIYPGQKRPLNVNDVIQIGNVQLKVVI